MVFFLLFLGLKGTDTSFISVLQFVLLLSKDNLFLVGQFLANLKRAETVVTRLSHLATCLYVSLYFKKSSIMI